MQMAKAQTFSSNGIGSGQEDDKCERVASTQVSLSPHSDADSVPNH